MTAMPNETVPNSGIEALDELTSKLSMLDTLSLSLSQRLESTVDELIGPELNPSGSVSAGTPPYPQGLAHRMSQQADEIQANLKHIEYALVRIGR